MRAILVAHGQPSDPSSQEAPMRALAADVAIHLPEMEVRGCTLAADGALAAALTGATAPLVYPFFMADGWFVRQELPRRLNAAGVVSARVLAPFGAEPRLLEIARRAASGANRILLAGHGSQRVSNSGDTLETLATAWRAQAPEAIIVTGYVEQAPRLEDTARMLEKGVCLPFFALRAGHVLDDIPEALEMAGFDGPTLQPIGQGPDIPALIADSLRAAYRETDQRAVLRSRAK